MTENLSRYCDRRHNRKGGKQRLTSPLTGIHSRTPGLLARLKAPSKSFGTQARVPRSSENGPFHAVTFSRTCKDSKGDLQDTQQLFRHAASAPVASRGAKPTIARRS